MKSIISIILAAVLFTVLTACGSRLNETHIIINVTKKTFFKIAIINILSFFI